MRISTYAMHQSALESLLKQQNALSRTQLQVATGRRLLSPADDPAAAVHIAELERALAESAQFARNSDMAEARLSLTETALANAGETLQRVRELVVQANTATMDADSRALIANEVKELLGELFEIANRKDANGEYLFAGYSTLTQPFVRTGTGIDYVGDQGVRMLQIGPTLRVPDGQSGQKVFLDVPAGNGSFVTAANPANTGSGVIDAGVIADRTAWVPGDYTLRFTSPTTWEVVDSTNTVVANGTYTSGEAIEFNGARVTVTGAPETGDTFAISRAGSKDMFSMIEDVLATLEAPIDSPAGRAQVTTRLGAALTQIDRAIDHLLAVRGEVGSRLSSIERAADARADLDLEITQSLAELRDLDYAEAVSRMNRQLLGLEAAQLSYARISQLSLFDYL